MQGLGGRPRPSGSNSAFSGDSIAPTKPIGSQRFWILKWVFGGTRPSAPARPARHGGGVPQGQISLRRYLESGQGGVRNHPCGKLSVCSEWISQSNTCVAHRTQSDEMGGPRTQLFPALHMSHGCTTEWERIVLAYHLAEVVKPRGRMQWESTRTTSEQDHCETKRNGMGETHSLARELCRFGSFLMSLPDPVCVSDVSHCKMWPHG